MRLLQRCFIKEKEKKTIHLRKGYTLAFPPSQIGRVSSFIWLFLILPPLNLLHRISTALMTRYQDFFLHDLFSFFLSYAPAVICHQANLFLPPTSSCIVFFNNTIFPRRNGNAEQSDATKAIGVSTQLVRPSRS